MIERIDWQAASKQTGATDKEWLQSLSVEDSIALYCDLAQFALSQRDESEGWKRLEDERWREKLAYRQKLKRAAKLSCEDEG